MNKIDILLRAVGRIEGRLEEISNLSQRVSRIEQCQAWLKGGWAAVVAMYVYICQVFYGR